MTELLKPESCLLGEMSGLPVSARVPLTAEEALAANVAADLEDVEAAVSAPPIYRTYQARAVTPRRRTKADIDTIVIHTPEGGESGTLSVLNGTGAAFDWFLPPSGRLYKCNDYYRYIAWHAGDWPYNERSIGIEQWDYAARMHLAPEEHYRRLARLCAHLVETLDLAVRHAKRYGEYGFIYHRTITPGSRCDPDACGRSRFNMELLLDLVLDYKRGTGPSPAPQPKPGPKKLWRVQVGAFNKKKNAEALAARLKKDGFDAYVMHDGFWRVQCGALRERENADALAARLKKAGYPAFVRYA